ncbi:MAG: aldo/keto reductase [Clostridiales Family XIII bacterium]|jgi:methylglyoxal reductase|nr:aldo/keto reductase [Clostridiales Family XIII bacterium]
MKTTKIGSFETSTVALGTWAIGGGHWWGDNDDQTSIDAIRKAVESGINLIDTAPPYGFGHSEEVVGKATADIRDKVRIATKCGLVWDTDEGAYFFEAEGRTVRRNLSESSIIKQLETSLRRLQTDHLDLYITHWQSVPEFPTPIEETMGALLKLKEQGKILAIGISNATPEILEEYLKYGKVDLIQEKYSMISPKGKAAYGDLLDKNNIVFQPYASLETGLLTGKIKADYVAEPTSARDENPWFKKENLKTAVEMMDKWQPLAEKYDATYAQLAIAWEAAQGNISVLCGARTIAQVLDNVKGGDIDLSPEDIKIISDAAEVAIGKFVGESSVGPSEE